MSEFPELFGNPVHFTYIVTENMGNRLKRFIWDLHGAYPGEVINGGNYEEI